ncbi:MAG: VWA domain-containing protein [Proteobacteria bacterium]|nr:VWA domain-containing protein [Pseudomonadota bacterium]
MRKLSLFIASLCLLTISGCDDDSSGNPTPVCGDGILNDDEICDGTEFKEGAKVCPDGLVLKDEAAFACTSTCGLEFSAACAAPNCGDGVLSSAEICDGDKFRDSGKVCPDMLEEVENPVWKCTNTCQIDISAACRVKNSGSACGNGKLDDGEVCDGTEFKEGAQVCPDGTKEKADAVFACSDKCELDISAACAKVSKIDNIDLFSADDLKKVAALCTSDDCVTKSECKQGAGYAACMCSHNINVCRTYEACLGLRNCEYNCGDEGTCAWVACRKDSACTGNTVCDPSNLDTDGDADGDGIPNGIELESALGLDPCNADTDGDTVPDGTEDLNHNGKFEPDKGETDPSDSTSVLDVNGGQYQVIDAGCKAEKILSGSDATLKYMTVAKLEGATYTDEKADGFVVSFSDKSKKVVGLFGSKGSEISVTSEQLLGKALAAGTFAANSIFTSPVPMLNWIDGNKYKKEYQIIPDHMVERVKFTIKLGGDGQKTLEDVRDKLVAVFGKVNGGEKTTTSCPDNNAILYVTRSEYKSTQMSYIYSIALTCANNTNVAAMNEMDDVFSGTLVSPTKAAYAKAPAGGYGAFKNFICQAEEFGQSARAVDFLWVIDNTGSMEDEQDNVVKAVQTFAKRLGNSGIDYRFAVTTTDAYLLDEVSKSSPSSYKSGYETIGANDFPTKGYMNMLGIRTATTAIAQNYGGFFGEAGLKGEKSPFALNVKEDSSCSGSQLKNVCGKGYEDGLKSGVLTLSRLAIDINSDEPGELFESDKKIYSRLRHAKKHIACKSFVGSMKTEEACDAEIQKGIANKKDPAAALTLRDDALKYIIWVTDEESRQFKEEQVLSTHTGDLEGCLTGYKLSGSESSYTMATGSIKDNPGDAAEVCNPSMKAKLTQLVADGTLNSEMELSQIKTAMPEYYDMLMYYIQRYSLYAGKGGIAGFALVGDIGREGGGFCKRLSVCKKNCIKDGQKQPDSAEGIAGCESCDPDGWFDSPKATIGADYGLSYIHMARFLGAYNNGKMDGKEGGFASICNDSFENSINAIFEDVAGHVASHSLMGYPITSTISVVANINGKNVVLQRGADENGWDYDASQNAITFSGVKADPKEYIAISYVIWQPLEG